MSWTTVNLNLIAKSLGELTYEQILHPVKSSEGYLLTLSSGASYTFSAWESVWNHLRVNPASIKKAGFEKITAAQFFIDAQKELEMNDIILGNFLEEMHNSLYSDMVLFEKQKKISVQEMVYWSGEKVQCYLNGHPKILLSKGRVGWGALELQEFAPEEEKSVNLHWIAVKKGKGLTSMISPALLDESMDENEKSRFFDVLKEHKLDDAQFDFLPVHPWQWNRFIKIQYADLIANHEMISLGIFGDDYLPQISIRTLSNISRPEKVDIKLPLTILNTSAIRGIPSRYIASCSELSQSVLNLCREDKLLRELGTDVLMEKAGMSIEHDHFSQVTESPYRYREYLGAIWRESTVSKLEESELGILTGSLFYQDHEGKSLIGAYIKKSGLTTEEWLKDYFRHVVIALYHLQIQYGLGLVSHGQNIILKMRNYRPVGVLLKDFQGDLRLSTDSVLSTREDFKGLDKLPKHYLIHDLITGHLVTVLRFVSGVMEESEGFKEKDFYRILGEVLVDYQSNYQVPEELSFLKETFERVLVNKVRFKMGYGDTSERLKPAVGTELKNPIYMGLR